jgi:HAE1 family hydrophobic/amphiphilic exporter-1
MDKSKKIIEIATRRRVTIAMFTIAVLLFGFVSFNRLKINLLPDLSYPTLTIRTEYLGAAPVEIENLISKPIEEALGIVKNVQHGFCQPGCPRKTRCASIAS